MLRILGIDIGTSSISGIVIDGETGKVLKTISVDNDTQIKVSVNPNTLQSPNDILEKALNLKKKLVEQFAPIDAIGVTGQMHGILYIDNNGNAVSPLYTWQSKSGNLPFKNSTYAEYLSELTGYSLASGYGLVTDFINRQTDSVSPLAKKLCTIHDYLVMRLVNKTEPVTHISDAASLGCFDIKKGDFDLEALKKIGCDRNFLPDVKKEPFIAGYDEFGIPVAVAIGDNQASVIGSIKGENCALVNIGTGSQVSLSTHSPVDFDDGEIRPLDKDIFMLVGAPLCGGKSYSLLHNFFKEFTDKLGFDSSLIYVIMNELAEIDSDTHSLKVDTRFSGTRKDPTITGSISNITTENFTPKDLVKGFLWGIAEELFDLYKKMIVLSDVKITAIAGSGNAIRKNNVLKEYLEKLFGMTLNIPLHTEEAAFGAAIFSGVAAKHFDSISQAQNKLIKYI